MNGSCGDACGASRSAAAQAPRLCSREERWSAAGIEHNRRYSVFRRMSDCDMSLLGTGRIQNLFGPTPKVQERSSKFTCYNFHVFPANSFLPSGPQRLQRCLLRGKTASKMLKLVLSRSTVLELILREDAIGHFISTLKGSANSSYLDDVYPNTYDHSAMLTFPQNVY
jgi:hypothetical protein